MRRGTWQRLQPASSRAGTALLLNRAASGTGSLFGECSAHVRGSGSGSFQPGHLCPAAPGDSATTGCFVEEEVTAPGWSRAGLLFCPSSSPSVKKLLGQLDYTKQDKPSDLWTVRAGHSPPPSAKGCSVLERWPGCTFLTAGSPSQRWISSALYC